MRTPAAVKDHPIHAMLVGLPIGAWLASLVFDLGGYAFPSRDLGAAAFYAMAVGLAGALLAAVFGLVDYRSLPLGSRARRVGTYHMLLNLTAVALYGANLGLRTSGWPRDYGVALSVLAAAVLGVGGWLGGELVYVERVGVREGEGVPARPREHAVLRR